MTAKFLLVIPARGGSKGVPRKNLFNVEGKPLIAYAIENALNTQLFDKIIVSTEDDEIAAVAQQYGAEVPFMRPPELANDDISLIPVIQHAGKIMDEEHNFKWTYACCLQPTAPLLSSRSLDAAAKLAMDTESDAVITVQEIQHNHPYHALKMDSENRLERLMPEGDHYLQKQDRPTFFAGTGGFYARKRSLLNSWSGQDFCLGQTPRAVLVSPEEALNIDSELDMRIFKCVLNEVKNR